MLVPRTSLSPRLCSCGCGLYYQPIRKDQRFIPEHRHYPTHACPTCGAQHREKVSK